MTTTQSLSFSGNHSVLRHYLNIVFRDSAPVTPRTCWLLVPSSRMQEIILRLLRSPSGSASFSFPAVFTIQEFLQRYVAFPRKWYIPEDPATLVLDFLHTIEWNREAFIPQPRKTLPPWKTILEYTEILLRDLERLLLLSFPHIPENSETVWQVALHHVRQICAFYNIGHSHSNPTGADEYPPGDLQCTHDQYRRFLEKEEAYTQRLIQLWKLVETYLQKKEEEERTRQTPSSSMDPLLLVPYAVALLELNLHTDQIQLPSDLKHLHIFLIPPVDPLLSSALKKLKNVFQNRHKQNRHKLEIHTISAHSSPEIPPLYQWVEKNFVISRISVVSEPDPSSPDAPSSIHRSPSPFVLPKIRVIQVPHRINQVEYVRERVREVLRNVSRNPADETFLLIVCPREDLLPYLLNAILTLLEPADARKYINISGGIPAHFTLLAHWLSVPGEELLPPPPGNSTDAIHKLQGDVSRILLRERLLSSTGITSFPEAVQKILQDLDQLRSSSASGETFTWLQIWDKIQESLDPVLSSPVDWALVNRFREFLLRFQNRFPAPDRMDSSREWLSFLLSWWRFFRIPLRGSHSAPVQIVGWLEARYFPCQTAILLDMEEDTIPGMEPTSFVPEIVWKDLARRNLPPRAREYLRKMTFPYHLLPEVREKMEILIPRKTESLRDTFPSPVVEQIRAWYQLFHNSSSGNSINPESFVDEEVSGTIPLRKPEPAQVFYCPTSSSDSSSDSASVKLPIRLWSELLQCPLRGVLKYLNMEQPSPPISWLDIHNREVGTLFHTWLNHYIQGEEASPVQLVNQHFLKEASPFSEFSEEVVKRLPITISLTTLISRFREFWKNQVKDWDSNHNLILPFPEHPLEVSDPTTPQLIYSGRLDLLVVKISPKTSPEKICLYLLEFKTRAFNLSTGRRFLDDTLPNKILPLLTQWLNPDRIPREPENKSLSWQSWYAHAIQAFLYLFLLDQDLRNFLERNPDDASSGFFSQLDKKLREDYPDLNLKSILTKKNAVTVTVIIKEFSASNSNPKSQSESSTPSMGRKFETSLSLPLDPQSQKSLVHLVKFFETARNIARRYLLELNSISTCIPAVPEKAMKLRKGLCKLCEFSRLCWGDIHHP